MANIDRAAGLRRGRRRRRQLARRPRRQLADKVCQALGFTGGEIYTFGATTLPGFDATLPVVTGYRTCLG
eukprot:SAG31_NODE_28658_length_407_cov_0.327922_1_plen_69_part_01